MSKGMPWEKFWYKNFLEDLKICSAETRGFWISFLSFLWGEGGIGEFTGKISDFARITSCTEREVESSISEIELRDVCIVKRSCNASGNGIVTLINRRLKREEKEREITRLRVNEWRSKANVTRHVTAVKRHGNGEEDIEDKEDKKNRREEEQKNRREEEQRKEERERKTKSNDGLLNPEQKTRMNDAIVTVLKKYPRFNHQKILSDAVRSKKHPEAIIYSLQETAKDCKGINPEVYFTTILQRTSGNYYESEAIRNHDEIKKAMPTIGEALHGAIKNMPAEMPNMPEEELLPDPGG